MKKTLLAITLLFAFVAVFSQDEDAEKDTLGWNNGGLASLTFSQVAFYQWSAGGDPSMSGVGILNLYSNYITLTSSWKNNLDLGFGLVRQGSLTRKTNDRIEFTSQYGLKASEKWNYSALVNFRTQFTSGYKYYGDTAKSRISDFFSPAYLTGSVGMDYSPNDNLSLFLSPVATKMTFVMDDSLSAEGQFGVDPGNNFRAELGGFVRVVYNLEIMENVDLGSKVDFFSNYLDKPGNVDVNFELFLAMQINKFLQATVSMNGIYDDNINLIRKDGSVGPGWQIKEVMGVGFSYKF